MFRQIQAYSKSWHSQTYSYIIRHIHNPQLVQAYSEPLKYLAGFRHYSRTIHAYSEPYLGRFRHIQNSGLFRHVMLHACPGKFTKLHIFRHAFFLTLGHISADSSIFRILVLSVQITQSNTCSSSQVILLNHCSNLFGTFFHFCCKGKHSKLFYSGQYFNNNNKNNSSMSSTLARHPPHPHYTRQEATQVRTTPTPPTLGRYPRKHATHVSTNSTPFPKLVQCLVQFLLSGCLMCK